jgi:hypothetical protein
MGTIPGTSIGTTEGTTPRRRPGGHPDRRHASQRAVAAPVRGPATSLEARRAPRRVPVGRPVPEIRPRPASFDPLHPGPADEVGVQVVGPGLAVAAVAADVLRLADEGALVEVVVEAAHPAERLLRTDHHRVDLVETPAQLLDLVLGPAPRPRPTAEAVRAARPTRNLRRPRAPSRSLNDSDSPSSMTSDRALPIPSPVRRTLTPSCSAVTTRCMELTSSMSTTGRPSSHRSASTRAAATAARIMRNKSRDKASRPPGRSGVPGDADLHGHLRQGSSPPVLSLERVGGCRRGVVAGAGHRCRQAHPTRAGAAPRSRGSSPASRRGAARRAVREPRRRWSGGR